MHGQEPRNKKRYFTRGRSSPKGSEGCTDAEEPRGTFHYCLCRFGIEPTP